MKVAISAISLISLSLLIVLCNASAANVSTFGTKVVPGDYDIGRLIKNMPDAAMGFWDVGPNPNVYDEGDVVYLDLPPFGIVNANDIRLNAFGNLPAGSKVTPSDNDIGKSLLPFRPYTYIGFLNLKGSEFYDLEDPVYIHQNMIVSLNKPMSTLTKIKPSATSSTQAQQDCDRCSNKKSCDGCYYKKSWDCFDHGTCNSKKDASLPKKLDLLGKSITSNTEDISNLTTAVVANTKDIGNLTDAVNYISLASQQTITNDIRLTSIGDFAAGKKVVDFDPDHNKLISSKILVSFPKAATNLGALRFYDKNGNGLYDGPDDVYMDISFPSGNPFGQVAINDIRLTAGGFF